MYSLALIIFVVSEKKAFEHFPIGSYVKTMSANGGHFEPRSGSLNTILEVDHLRTIDDRKGGVKMFIRTVGFTTTYAISAYHHKSCEFEPRLWRGVHICLEDGLYP